MRVAFWLMQMVLSIAQNLVFLSFHPELQHKALSDEDDTDEVGAG